MRPEDAYHQAAGKAHAELHRGSGYWPWQDYPVSLEPPFEEYNWQELTTWDLHFNDWDGPFVPKVGLHRDFRKQYNGNFPPLPRVPCFDEQSAIYIMPNERDDDSLKTARHFIHSLPYKYPIAFEFLAMAGRTSCRFVAPCQVGQAIADQAYAHYPQAHIILDKCRDNPPYGVPFRCAAFYLKASHTLPLQTQQEDPLRTVIGVADTFERGDWALIQVLFTPTTENWREAAEKAGAKTTKFTAPLYAVSIRLACIPHAFRKLTAWARLFENGQQQLLPEEEGMIEAELSHRAAFRPGLLLNLDELTGLVHLPAHNIVSRTLQRKKTVVQAPTEKSQPERGSVCIGSHTSRGRTVPVYIPFKVRRQHVHITGTSQQGKSTLVTHMALQDIQNGEGVVVIDPHGTLARDVLRNYPEHRRADLTYFDLSDTQHPISFNPLQVQADYQETAVDEVLTAFKRVFEKGWGERLHNIFLNTLWTIVHEGGTFEHLRRLFQDEEYRYQIIPKIQNIHVRSFWSHEFPELLRKPEAIEAAVNKLQRLLVFTAPRNILCQPRNALHITPLLRDGKVLIVNLATNVIKSEAANLIGSLLVNRIINVAMRRDPDTAKPIWLYIDEFQTMLTSNAVDFDVILAQSAKFGLHFAGLVHQHLKQLPADVYSSVVNGTTSGIHFCSSPDDAPTLARSLEGFTAEDLRSLTVGKAIAHIGPRTNSFNFDSLPPLDVPRLDRTLLYLQDSRERYGMPRTKVDAQFVYQEPTRPERQAEPVKQPPPKKQQTLGSCPQCKQGQIRIVTGHRKDGSGTYQFWSCTHFPTCRWKSWTDPTALPKPPDMEASPDDPLVDPDAPEQPPPPPEPPKGPKPNRPMPPRQSEQ